MKRFNFTRLGKGLRRNFKNGQFRLKNNMILICLVYFILFFAYLSFEFDEILTSYHKKKVSKKINFKKSKHSLTLTLFKNLFKYMILI